ncbi:hypothetical protein ACIQVK_39480 [Streptomyces sp. NPDC090493]|uniref:hypothetical protein n=1 Tax=Streptomyces sp. NPDC090493 TaxID=3365964 RepID=UPI003810F9A0
MPSIGLVIAGDAVYGDVRLYLGEAKENGAQQWLHSLDVLADLRPASVVSGHERDGDEDGPDDVGRTRRYIEDFTAAEGKANSCTDLYETVVRLYPDRVHRGVLWNSAKAALS